MKEQQTEPEAPGRGPRQGSARRPEREALVIHRLRAAPVVIVGYAATLEKVEAQWGGPRIRHELVYRNRTRREIAAVEFGLATYDLFDELMACRAGLCVRPLAPAGAVDILGIPVPASRREWLQHGVDPLAFHTAIAWVDKVRYRDGEVWRESRRKIAERIRKLKRSFETGPLVETEGAGSG